MMEERIRKEIRQLKGADISHKFIEEFEREWLEVTGRLKRSGANLAKIVLREK